MSLLFSYLSIFNTSSWGSARVSASYHSEKVEWQPGKAASSTQGHIESNNHSLSHDTPFRFFGLKLLFLDCGRKLENLEGTQEDAERTCKLQTERSDRHTLTVRQRRWPQRHGVAPIYNQIKWAPCCFCRTAVSCFNSEACLRQRDLRQRNCW